MPAINPPRIEILDESVSQGRVTRVNFTGAGVVATVSGELATITASGAAGAPVMFSWEIDLGVGRRSGTFDMTGLAGLTAGKIVTVVQTASAISSKGNARDEPEMDMITATGYVVDAATIRVYWFAPSVVVGNYIFGYSVNG